MLEEHLIARSRVETWVTFPKMAAKPGHLASLWTKVGAY